MRLLLILLLFIPTALAGTITMQTTLEDANINSSTGTISIKLINIGDEIAKDVSILPVSKHIKANEKFIGDLHTNKPIQLNSSFNFLSKKPGSYPFYIMIKYKDINNYPFSVITPGRINYLEKTTADIHATMQDLKLKESSTLNLKIQNIGSEPYNINAELYLPRELVSNSVAKTTLIEPKTGIQYDFLIKNFNALENSKYAVFAIVEYETDKHYFTTARNIITIVDADENPLIIYALATLIVLIVIFFYTKRREFLAYSNRRSNNESSNNNNSDSERREESSNSSGGREERDEKAEA